MELERLSLAALLWSIALFGVFLCRKRSPLHWMVVALIVSALGGSFFPVMSLFVPPSTWRNISHLTHETLLVVQAQYAAWTAGLLLAVCVASQRGWLRPSGADVRFETGDEARGRDAFVAWSLVFSGALLYALYVRRVGLDTLTSHEDYAEKYLLSTGLGPLMFGLSMMIAGCLWAEASRLPRATKNAFALIAVLIAVWSVVFTSVRTNFLILLLGYLYIACVRRKVEVRRVRVSLLAVLLAAYLLLESFTLFRGLYRGDLGEAVTMFVGQGQQAFSSAVGGSELSHPFVTTAEVVQSRIPGELGGRSYLRAFEALMPLSIDPDRPLTLSETFAQSNYAAMASRGGGTAFSIVAEAWLDFGPVFGPFLVGAVFGWILIHVERRRVTRPDGMLARLAPYMLFYVAVEHRNESATLLKQAFMIAIVVLPLWIAADVARVVRMRRQTGAPLGQLVARGRA